MTDFQKVIEKIALLESQLLEVNVKINNLQTENQELRKLVVSRNEQFSYKRPANAAGLENPSGKKFKCNSELVTPKPFQENRVVIEDTAESSQRRRVMKEIVKDFQSNIRPKYKDHLIKERGLVPNLRGTDGRIILKNIRYIR